MFHVEFLTPIGNTARQFIHPLSESPLYCECQPTVDGSEIRRENQLRLVVYPHDLQGFIYIQTVVGLKISEASTSYLGAFQSQVGKFSPKCSNFRSSHGLHFPPQKNQSMLCPPKPEHINQEQNPWSRLFIKVGGWTNPLEKYARQIGSSPICRGENETIFELPPPSFSVNGIMLF